MAITGAVNGQAIPQLFVPATPSPKPAMQQLHVVVDPIAHLAGESWRNSDLRSLLYS